MEPIRRVISRIIGEQIPKDGWQKLLEHDRMGRIDPRTSLRIIILLAERLEAYEERSNPPIQP